MGRLKFGAGQFGRGGSERARLNHSQSGSTCKREDDRRKSEHGITERGSVGDEEAFLPRSSLRSEAGTALERDGDGESEDGGEDGRQSDV